MGAGGGGVCLCVVMVMGKEAVFVRCHGDGKSSGGACVHAFAGCCGLSAGGALVYISTQFVNIALIKLAKLKFFLKLLGY